MSSPPKLTAVNELSSEVERNFQLLEIQRKILALVATSDEYQFILEELCRCAEMIHPDAVASIMLFNGEERVLNIRAAPSMTAEAAADLDGLKPGQRQGSCGTALFSNKPQYVADTLQDSRWVKFESYARKHDVYACWSFPIRSQSQLPVGTIALSSRRVKKPTTFDKLLLETCAWLAGVILIRENQDMRLKKAANYDDLTGLPNRNLFRFRLQNEIDRATRNQCKFALMFVDLDNFKPINDLYGHEIGDKVLQIAAERISAPLRQNDLVSRYGGDEFLVLIEDCKNVHSVAIVADKVLKCLSQVISIGPIKLNIYASIGIAIYPENGDSAEVLLQHADEAMYQAKEKRGDSFRFYYQQLN